MQSGSNGTDRGIEPEPADDAVGPESNTARTLGGGVGSDEEPASNASTDHPSGTGDQGPRPAESSTATDDRVADLERRVADLEADLDAVRGLLDGVEAVDEAVERRASTALAKAEALEARVDAEETGLVRERLPDTDPEAAGSGGSVPTAGGDTAETDDSSERASESTQNDALRGWDTDRSAGSPDVGNATSHRGRESNHLDRPDPDAATAGSGGSGAISSVGPGGGVDGAHGATDGGTRDRGGATDADDGRSLASRLRDAFR